MVGGGGGGARAADGAGARIGIDGGEDSGAAARPASGAGSVRIVDEGGGGGGGIPARAAAPQSGVGALAVPGGGPRIGAGCATVPGIGSATVSRGSAEPSDAPDTRPVAGGGSGLLPRLRPPGSGAAATPATAGASATCVIISGIR